MSLLTLLVYSPLFACIPGPVTFETPKDDTAVVVADSGDPTDDSDEPTDDSSEPTDDSGDDTGPVEYDCDAMPDFNLGDRTMSEARGYHGVVMDDDGHLIGWDQRSALIKSTYDGDRETWIPGQNSVEQLARHPDGTIYMGRPADSSVYSITTDGAVTRIAGGLNGIYGVTLGPDGMLYIAHGPVSRVDPNTGETETFIAQPPRSRWTAHSTGFSLDSTRFYVGTIGEGDVLYVDLDEDLNPTMEPAVWVRLGGSWMDAVGVDICGYVYIAEYFSSSLYRISPDGSDVTSMVATRSREYGHGLVWGSGIGGWRTDSLYQPQPYNSSTIREVIIGLPTGDSIRTWNGEPVEL